ncbi:hypothetical protein ACFL2V_08190 [Pseudomonadota bacterium]
MKSITIKLAALVFAFAASFSAIACNQSGQMSVKADTEMLSAEQMQSMHNQISKASF